MPGVTFLGTPGILGILGISLVMMHSFMHVVPCFELRVIFGINGPSYLGLTVLMFEDAVLLATGGEAI